MTSNTEVVRRYFDSVLNAHRPEAFFDFVHKDATFRGSPYVGLGFNIDPVHKDRAVIDNVFEGGPAKGNLMPGDELIYAEDATRVWETAEDLRRGLWGQGKPGTWVRLLVNRDGEQIEFEFERAVIDAASFPASVASRYVEDWLNRLYPDVTVEILDTVEQGDVVACYSRNAGTNTDHDQYVIWESTNFLRVQDGKIIESWGIDDALSELMQTGHKVEKSKEQINQS